ncbi:MAG: Y-family DNA polymerase [Vibrio sp.]
MFALVDANSFYCSAEQVFRPEWRNKPIIVLSNNDGMVVAANRQAKEVGVPKFQPFFKIKNLCKQRGVIALSSNYELYSDLSAKMMQVIGRFAPEQHVYSIDESFLRLHRCQPMIKDFRHHSMQIRKAVWKECRLPVCVGMGPTVTLAKAANHAAKKVQGFNGVCVIDDQQIRIKVLQSMDVSDVWGVGRKLSGRLKMLNIKTAWDLALFSPQRARREFSIDMERTVRELNGFPCISWEQSRVDKKQIFSTRSMGNRISDLDALQQALSKHAAIAANKARQQNTLCPTLTCFAANSPHDEKPVSFKSVHHFEYPTNDTSVITKVVTQMATQLYHPDVLYYKIGVGLVDLFSASHQQLDLLNPTPSNDKLMTIFDHINQKYGGDTLFLAAQGIDNEKKNWGMKRERLTPQYTTKWRDLPKILCQ